MLHACPGASMNGAFGSVGILNGLSGNRQRDCARPTFLNPTHHQCMGFVVWSPQLHWLLSCGNRPAAWISFSSFQQLYWLQSSLRTVYSLHCIQCGCRRNVDWKISVAIFSIFVSTSKRLLFSKVRNPIPLAYGGFIQCITKILESSKSYTCKIYVSNIGAYPCQTSIIV
jgi:hypothetical protein